MCIEKNGGGLGVRNLTKMNQDVINIKFGGGGGDGGWNIGDIRGGHGTDLWKKIRKYWITFHHNTAFSLGNGRSLHF